MPTIHAKADTSRDPFARSSLRRLWARWLEMRRAQAEREELYRLDERDLRDFGASRVDVEAEARRRFRDLPPMA